jgi:ABC-type molybdate transport system substrate-binding protein
MHSHNAVARAVHQGKADTGIGIGASAIEFGLDFIPLFEEPEEAGKVSRLDIPDALNVSATYPIAPVKSSQNPELAQAFIDLVLSPEGEDILAKYNFIPTATPPEG